MDHFQRIYHEDAARYERLVAREDQHGNLFAALMDIYSFSGARIAELGAGTGRITRMLSVLAGHIYALDVAPAMLREAQRVLSESGMENWSLLLADNRAVPLSAQSVDLAIEGWSFGHALSWYGADWQVHIDAMLAEMQRVVQPGGAVILVETMGTGRRQPEPPTPELAQLYTYFQDEHGFDYRWIRTDYQFASVGEADELIRFFFGDAMADDLVAGQRIIISECTGLWYKTI